MERYKRKEACEASRKFSLYTVVRSEAGFTYVELAVALSLVVVLIPAVMTLGLVVQSGSNRIIGHQQLAMEAEGFLSDVRDEIRQGSDFRLSSQHWLEFDLPSGETVRYRLDQRRIIRSLRAADGTQFQGTTILLHDVYYFACVPDEEGVEMEVGIAKLAYRSVG